MSQQQTPSKTAVPRDPVLYVITDKMTGEQHLVYAKSSAGALAVMASTYEARRATAEDVMHLAGNGVTPLNKPEDDKQGSLPV